MRSYTASAPGHSWHRHDYRCLQRLGGQSAPDRAWSEWPGTRDRSRHRHGFSGFLTLPWAVVQALELDRLGEGEALVGDGTIQVFDLYEAILIWDDEPLTVDVATAETAPLMGMRLIYGHDLRIQAIEGGAVTIESLTCM